MWQVLPERPTFETWDLPYLVLAFLDSEMPTISTICASVMIDLAKITEKEKGLDSRPLPAGLQPSTTISIVKNKTLHHPRPETTEKASQYTPSPENAKVT